MARALLGYGESELDPAVQAEIHLATARNESRIAILQILVALGFGLWYRFIGTEVTLVYLFAIVSVIPLLGDAAMRRSAARRLVGRQPTR